MFKEMSKNCQKNRFLPIQMSKTELARVVLNQW
jgi:hypothetical protein